MEIYFKILIMVKSEKSFHGMRSRTQWFVGLCLLGNGEGK